MRGRNALTLGASVNHFDMLVIGSGPAGRRGAIQAAKLGKNVLVVERGRRVGGVSVHTGTIPSKTLRETALNLSGWRERGFYGRSYRAKQDIGSDGRHYLLGRTHRRDHGGTQLSWIALTTKEKAHGN
jgi:NAD(P) transhydrogenase